MARTRGLVSTLLLLSAVFCAAAVVFWTRWVWAASPDAWTGLQLMLGVMLLLGLVLLGIGAGICVALLLARKRREFQHTDHRVLAFRRHS